MRNWMPDITDSKDRMYVHTHSLQPDIIDLRAKMPAICNQGKIQSCAATVLASQLGVLYPDKGNFSRLFIYYGSREIEGTVNSDVGAQIRTGIKFLATIGCCLEDVWPYDIRQWNVRPPIVAYEFAITNKISSYMRLSTLDDMLDCLAAGFPFVFGMTIYTSFNSIEVRNAGIVNMPTTNEKMISSHAVEAVGYNMITRRFLVRNSRGVNWGQDGYFTIPFEYMTLRSLANDIWTIRG